MTTFEPRELRRVGTAATMIVLCGTAIILSVTLLIGHYNPLIHSGPKAALDGAVIALLIGQRGRWRCLALLGIVYGLVLLLQVGVFYLLPVMVIAGVASAMVGRSLDLVHRATAVLLAAALYELLAGCGGPIKIYFATGGKSEPFLWGLWGLECLFRLAGAMVGVWLAFRWLERRSGARDESIPQTSAIPSSRTSAPRTRKSSAAVAARIVACIFAGTIPLGVESTRCLAAIAIAFVLYALVAGVRWKLLRAVAALLWSWAIFGLLSFAWHHDWPRVLDLGRTLVLRFTPLTIASIVLVTTARPADVLKLLRRLRVPAAVLIPLSMVLRSVPHARRQLRRTIEQMRAAGQWRGPISLVRRPRTVISKLLGGQFRQWADSLAAADQTSSRL